MANQDLRGAPRTRPTAGAHAEPKSAFEWMVLPLKRYAEFSGRSRRKEYWMFVLLITLATVAAVILLGIFGAFNDDPGGTGVLAWVAIALVGLAYLAIFIPTIAVQVRRFHDQDRSGWFVLLGFIPYIGGLIVLVFMLLEGTKGPNQYGPDPKANEHAGEVFE